MSETAKKSRTGIYVVVGILVVGGVIGIVYLFSKSSEGKDETTTVTSTSQTTGLAGLLSGVNLSGLSLFGV